MEILVLMIIYAIFKFLYKGISNLVYELRYRKTLENIRKNACSEVVDVSNLPAFKSMLSNFLYPRKEKQYTSCCWRCRKNINSDINMRCPFCGWYICSCGKCKPTCKRKEQFDYLFFCPDELLEKIRIIASNTGIFNEYIPAFTRCTNFFAYLEENEEVQQIKKEIFSHENNITWFTPNKLEKVEQKKTIESVKENKNRKEDILKQLQDIKVNDIVFHDKFGKGTIIQINEEQKVIEIKFSSEDKRFVYPNAFVDGFLKI